MFFIIFIFTLLIESAAGLTLSKKMKVFLVKFKTSAVMADYRLISMICIFKKVTKQEKVGLLTNEVGLKKPSPNSDLDTKSNSKQLGNCLDCRKRGFSVSVLIKLNLPYPILHYRQVLVQLIQCLRHHKLVVLPITGRPLIVKSNDT